MHTNIWSENEKERVYLGDLSVDGSMLLKSVLQREVVRVWTAFICLVIGAFRGIL
jgi:hypothetical protein